MLRFAHPSRRVVVSVPTRTCEVRSYARRKKAEPEPIELPPSGVLEHPTGKKLHTPGPLTTSNNVRQAMMRELGSRETEMKDMIKSIRQKVLDAGELGEEHDVVLLEGCGTMSVESVITNTVPPGGKLLVVRNGTYGDRIRDIAKLHNIEIVDLAWEVDQSIDVEKIRETLLNVDGITNLAMVHCETSTGMLLPWDKVVEMVNELPAERRPILFADAMSSYGATDVSWAKSVDFLVTSPNKCLQGVPGFGVIIFKKSSAEKCKAYPKRSWGLDFIAQWESLNETGEFRSTPPTHALVAFHEALLELEQEGGWKARQERYISHKDLILLGMISMGFKPLLVANQRSHILSSFVYPDKPTFNWDKFYNGLYSKNFVLYPGKLTDKTFFRIGTIGAIVLYDIVLLLDGIRDTKVSMKF